jgi:GNAT superfamily N-acetyltransferase
MTEAYSIQAFVPSELAYESLAGIVAAYSPDHLYDYEYRTADAFRDFDAAFVAAARPLTRYVAAEAATGQLVGFAHVFEIAWAPPAGRYWCALRVHPEHGRRRIGRRLYQRVERDLVRLGARAVQAELHEDLGDLIAPLARRGFHERLRSWTFALDPRAVDPARLAAGALDAPLQLTTLPAERARDPAWLARLHDLYAAVAQEVPIPGYPHATVPVAWIERQLAGLPTSLPAACFIVRDGERYAGLSYLHGDLDEPGVLHQQITGVRAAYRGRGIASALKLATIAFARRHGYTQIQTCVEANNPSMLAINRRLGFTRHTGLILLEKRLRD